jgi:hypothetical protein
MTRSKACALVAMAVAVAPLFASPAIASAQIDRRHAAADRQNADTCILGAINIYTDPYARRRTNHQIVADIAHICATQFYVYADDVGLDSADARKLLRQTIEAGLRGQFH